MTQPQLRQVPVGDGTRPKVVDVWSLARSEVDRTAARSNVVGFSGEIRSEPHPLIVSGSLQSNGTIIISSPSSKSSAAPGLTTSGPTLSGLTYIVEATLTAKAIAFVAKDVVLARPKSASNPALDRRIAILARETRLPNWDCEHGQAIPTEEWARATQLCNESLADQRLPVPVPSPCGDGTIHLRWSKSGTDVVVELRGDQIWWTLTGAGSRRTGTSSGFTEVIALLRTTFA